MKLLRFEGVALVDPRSAPPSTGPKWCALFPLNTERFRSDFPGGSIVFDAAFFVSVLANWRRAGKPRLPVDYGHDENGIAAGWMSDLRVGAGYFEALIEWTDRARAAIAARELQCLSPTFATDAEDPTTGELQGPTLYGAGLLNTPFLQDLPPVEASRTPRNKEKRIMELKQLAALLGLPETATAEECAKCLGDMKSKLAALPPHKEPDGDEDPKGDEPSGPEEAKRFARAVTEAVEPMKTALARTEAEKVALAKRVEALEKDRRDAEVKDLVKVALAKGIAQAPKFVDAVAKFGLEHAREMVNMMPGTVSTKELGHATSEQVDEDALRAAAMAEIDKEMKLGRTLNDARKTVFARPEFKALTK
jgi:phage I-like protein